MILILCMQPEIEDQFDQGGGSVSETVWFNLFLFNPSETTGEPPMPSRFQLIALVNVLLYLANDQSTCMLT